MKDVASTSPEDENGSGRITIRQVYDLAVQAREEARTLRIALVGEPGISGGALPEIRADIQALKSKIDGNEEETKITAEAAKSRKLTFREGVLTACVASLLSALFTALIYLTHVGGIGVAAH